MPAIQLAIFDLAGTTVQDDDGVGQAFRGALDAHRLHATHEEINAVMGLPKLDAVRLLLRDKLAPEEIEARARRLHDDFQDRMIRFYQEDPGISEIIGASDLFRDLRGSGVLVAVNTGFSRAIVEVLFDRLGWREGETLDASICSDEVERGRPSPDMIHALMQRLGVSDAQAVLKAGDTPSDLQEGTAAGCGWVIGVTYGTHTAAQLGPYPHTHLIGSLAEIPRIVGL